MKTGHACSHLDKSTPKRTTEREIPHYSSLPVQIILHSQMNQSSTVSSQKQQRFFILLLFKTWVKYQHLSRPLAEKPIIQQRQTHLPNSAECFEEAGHPRKAPPWHLPNRGSALQEQQNQALPTHPGETSPLWWSHLNAFLLKAGFIEMAWLAELGRSQPPKRGHSLLSRHSRLQKQIPVLRPMQAYKKLIYQIPPSTESCTMWCATAINRLWACPV